MRRFAISDIHGCAKTFKALLNRINFSKEDMLFLLGDYIDRGPDSCGVINHIMALQNEGYSVHCLRGNHEQMLLDCLVPSDFPMGGHQETIQSFGVNSVFEISESYVNWLNALPFYIELDDYILVHAGLDFSKENPMEDQTEMIWIRHWYESINKAWLGNRIIVHGHTPTRQLVIKACLRELNEIPAIDIDAGCAFDSFGFGNLCALNLDTLELTFHANIDKALN